MAGALAFRGGGYGPGPGTGPGPIVAPAPPLSPPIGPIGGGGGAPGVDLGQAAQAAGDLIGAAGGALAGAAGDLWAWLNGPAREDGKLPDGEYWPYHDVYEPKDRKSVV